MALPTPADAGAGLRPAHGWLRVKIFVQRFWQPTSACMACMPGSLGNIFSAVHWTNALQTGLVTGVLAVLLSFTPLLRAYRNRYGNALLVGSLTAFGDAWSHPSHFGGAWLEPLVTGAVSALLALLASLLFEDRARRIRAAWARLSN